MAIIRLDCNLNGGDSVTPNNELFYRIYGDIDAYAAPIHTTGTALTDANVTVDNDNVIITGVDGATNMEFKIAAVDGAGNEGILSDAVVGSNILFEDDFAGNVISTSIWNDIYNPTATVIMSQNDELLLQGAGTTEDAAFSHYLNASTSGMDISNVKAIGFDVKRDVNQEYGRFRIGLTSDTDVTASANFIGILRGTLSNNILRRLIVGTSSEVSSPEILLITTVKSFKITYDGTDVAWYYWNDPEWTILGTAYTITLSGTWHPIIEIGDDSSGAVLTTVDNFTVTNADYATQYPV